MQKVIIYKTDNGSVAVILPLQKTIDMYGIDAIAKKDVPAGKPYKIIDASELPTDLSLRNAWTVDEADLTDGVGHTGSTFEEVLNGNQN